MTMQKVFHRDIEAAQKAGLTLNSTAARLGVSRAAVSRAEQRLGEALPRVARDEAAFGNDHRAVALSLPADEAIDYLLEVIAGLRPTVTPDWLLPGVHLTRAERQMLRALVESSPRIATKSALLDALMQGREGDDAPEVKIIDVRICKLRQKLAPLGVTITTHWGVGYTIEAPEGFVWPWVAA